MLAEYTKRADPSIESVDCPTWLDPALAEPGAVDLTVLNYHRGLHSRWTPTVLAEWKTRKRAKVIVVFHDTYEVHPPDDIAWKLLEVCDRMIVHEPCDLLQDMKKVRYWRQGVLDPDGTVWHWPRYSGVRPTVGTCGFAFPWKGFELLCGAAVRAGWGVRIVSHNATPEQIQSWKRLNPWVEVITGFAPAASVIASLTPCDATAFLYQCANTGTSGAIRLGIAAGKPLLAFRACRQMRDLFADSLGRESIHWLDAADDVASALRHMTLTRFDAGMVALREQESWRHLGQRYTNLYREVVGAV